MASKTKQLDLKQKIFGVLVGLVFAVLIGVAIDTIYERPDFSDFCEENFQNPKLAPTIDCSKSYEANQLLEQQCYDQDMSPIYETDNNGCRIFKECSTCNDDYDKARSFYGMIVFIITLIIGLGAVFVSAYRKEDFLSLGLLIGGILLVIYGNMIYFADMHKWVRLISLLIEFIILIWLGYKKFSK